jgi:hypothetical protein
MQEVTYYSNGITNICDFTGTPNAPSTIPLSPSPPACPGGLDNIVITTTAAQRKYVGNGDGVCAVNTSAGGTLQADLSNEDSEDDAITRADAPIGSWTSCSSSCTGYKETRGAGDFTLAYRHLQLAVVTPGSANGVVYEATISIRRRAYGTSDPFVDWIELTHQYVGTGGTYTGPWLHVPVESGYEVEASACANAIDT